MIARSWRQQWRKEEAISMVLTCLRQGELAPLLTMWLGDGKARWGRIGRFEIAVAAKEPWKIGGATGDYETVVAKGHDVFMRLAEAAGPYGMLLDLLKCQKWNCIKEAVARKRSVDILREAVKNPRSEDPDRVLASMKFSLVSGNGGTLIAAYYANTAEEAVAAANALETLGMRPNVVKLNMKYDIRRARRHKEEQTTKRSRRAVPNGKDEKRHAKGEGNCKKNSKETDFSNDRP